MERLDVALSDTQTKLGIIEPKVGTNTLEIARLRTRLFDELPRLDQHLQQHDQRISEGRVESRKQV